MRRRGPVELVARFCDHPAMGFNRRKMEDERRQVAEKAAALGARPTLRCLRMPSV